jgi:hypothetical protein
MIKLSLCLINCCHEDISGSGCIAATFLTSALDGGDQLHALAALLPGKKSPGAHWEAGWVGPRFNVVAEGGRGKRKVSYCR